MVRRSWGHIDDEEWLANSWLASLPPVQRLAASKYGGASIGKGLALQEILRKAITEAQNYTKDRRIASILNNFPELKLAEIAASFNICREHLYRRYVKKATRLVTIVFRCVLDRSV